MQMYHLLSLSRRGSFKKIVLLLWGGFSFFILSPSFLQAQDPIDLLRGIQTLKTQQKGASTPQEEGSVTEPLTPEQSRLDEVKKIEGEPLSRIERFFVGEEGLRWLQIEKDFQKQRLGLDAPLGLSTKPAQSFPAQVLNGKETQDPLQEVIQKRGKGEPLEEGLVDLQMKEVELRKDLRQFGYNLFEQKKSAFNPEVESPVGPDYIVGPGDELTVTLWGTVEGIFQLQVSPEGEVTLPKVGVVPVAGIRYGDIESYLKEQLSRYYKDFNIRVTLHDIHMIQVYVVGEVTKPGRYSVSSLSTAFHALFAAGGITKDGSLRSVEVTRGGRAVQKIDLYDFILKGDTRQDVRLQNGDAVFVPLLGEVVAIAGEVYRPAIYEIQKETTFADLLEIAGGALPTGSDQHVQIERFEDHQRKIVRDVHMKTGSAQTPLSNLDLVKVYPLYPKPWEVVRLEGVVRYPGEYSYSPGMKISDLLTEEQFLPETFMEKAEIIRLDKQEFRDRVISFDPKKAIEGDSLEDRVLEPHDRLVFYSYFRRSGSIELSGEVVLPGRYSFEQGERLSSVLKRGGGFTGKAFLEGAIFTRQVITDSQQRQKEIFLRTQQQQLLKESASIAASGLGEDAQSVAYELKQRQELLQLQAERGEEGRMVIHLASLELFEGSPQDILLEDGDRLVVPQIPAYVAVMGEVLNSSTFLYRGGEGARYYLAQSGGFTSNAQKKGVYLLRADGTAAVVDSRTEIRPGDSIVIPTKIEVKYRPLPFWRDITSIVGSVAITLTSLSVIF